MIPCCGIWISHPSIFKVHFGSISLVEINMLNIFFKHTQHFVYIVQHLRGNMLKSVIQNIEIYNRKCWNLIIRNVDYSSYPAMVASSVLFVGGCRRCCSSPVMFFSNFPLRASRYGGMKQQAQQLAGWRHSNKTGVSLGAATT